MKDQVVCMREDWKREQVLVRQLENDLVFKENLLQETTELKFAQKNQIESLNNDVIHLNAKIRELSNRSVKEDKLTRPSSDQLHVGSLRIQELERLLLERQEELEESREELFSMKQGLEEIIEENKNMYQDLSIAQKVIQEKDEKINEQEVLILTLGEEVKGKEALQRKLNEKEVNEQLKRQNLDVSISQKSASISDNSRITGIRRQFTLNAMDSESYPHEEMTPLATNPEGILVNRKKSVDLKLSDNIERYQHSQRNMYENSKKGSIPDEQLHLHTN